MERMEGVDAGYLYLETPTMHMHTLKVALIRPAGRFDFAAFTDQLLGRLDRLPPFQRRILPVPASLNHPLWISDRDIDPETARLPPPAARPRRAWPSWRR